MNLANKAQALGRDIHTVLKQVHYDYQRMQYNTVVSGAMKMLNALEDFKATDDAGAAIGRCEGLSIRCACSTRQPRRTACPAALGGRWLCQRVQGFARCALAPGGRCRAGARRNRADAASQRQVRGALAFPPRRQSPLRWKPPSPARRSRNSCPGATAQKVVVVPGRLVNVVL